MNYKKINEWVLKLLFNKNEKHPVIQHLDHGILMGNGMCICLVQECYSFIRYPFPRQDPFSKTSLKYIMEPDGDYYKAKRTNQYINGKMKLQELTTECKRNQASCYVQQKYLDFFSKDACIYIKGPTNLVYIYEDGNYAGTIAPVRFKPEGYNETET